jgi:hypothetical protein
VNFIVWPRTHISDSSENTSESIHFVVTPNEVAIVPDVTMSVNILLRWIVLKSVKWKVIKVCFVHNATVYVKHHVNFWLLEDYIQ